MHTLRALLLATLFGLPCGLPAVLLGGCGTGDPSTEFTCTPACAAGFQCTASGCERVGAMVDISVPSLSDLGDMATACSPACAAPTAQCGPSGRCVVCTSDEHCLLGTTCSKRGNGDDTWCAPGCADDQRCQGLGLGGDGGAARVRCCAGACVDTSSDGDHCGGCGMACAPAHAQPRCSGGACVPGDCAPGWGNCNMDPKDGCESNLRLDVANCGACASVCTAPHGTPACSGSCYVGRCDYGFEDCNVSSKDGCEISLLTDANNCGGCGQPCPFVARGKASCAAGLCVPVCDLGFGNCNGNINDGCESQFTVDARNCGGCGMVCPQGLVCSNGACTCPQCSLPNAKSSCVNLMCVLVSCLPGYVDCNNVQKDGCEVDTSGDPANCGGCGNVCPMNLPSCVAGKCVIYQGLMQIADPGMDKNVVLANGGGALSMGLDAIDGSANVIMTRAAAMQVGGANAVGLPDNGFFVANKDHPDVQLAANNNNDGKKNARLLVKAGAFSVPLVARTWKLIQLYAISTEGASTLVVTLNYLDGTSDQTMVKINDWYTHPAGAGQFYLIDGLDRYSIGNNKYDPARTPGMVGFNLNVNPNKPTKSFDLTLQAGGWLVYFGAMGQ